MKKSNIITENEICLIDVFTQNNKYQNETWIKKRRFLKNKKKRILSEINVLYM